MVSLKTNAVSLIKPLLSCQHGSFYQKKQFSFPLKGLLGQPAFYLSGLLPDLISQPHPSPFLRRRGSLHIFPLSWATKNNCLPKCFTLVIYLYWCFLQNKQSSKECWGMEEARWLGWRRDSAGELQLQPLSCSLPFRSAQELLPLLKEQSQL